MPFSENLQSICNSDLIIRTGPTLDLQEEGYQDDIVIRLNLSSGEVTPLTYEDLTVPFYGMFWGALRIVMRYTYHYSDQDYQIELIDSESVIYSDSKEVDDEWYSESLTKEVVVQIFKEAVRTITDV